MGCGTWLCAKSEVKRFRHKRLCFGAGGLIMYTASLASGAGVLPQGAKVHPATLRRIYLAAEQPLKIPFLRGGRGRGGRGRGKLGAEINDLGL